MSTICAISTAPGVGGIAVIRVSGTDAFALCDKIFHAHREGHTIQSQKAYTLQYGTIENERGETVDNVVIAVFRAPTHLPEKIPSKYLAMVPSTYNNKYYNS